MKFSAKGKDEFPLGFFRVGVRLALGIFIDFLPIMGIQVAVVLVFSIPFRKANKIAAVAGVWISNPLTDQTAAFLGLGADIFLPMCIGGAVVGLIAMIPTYIFTRIFFSRYQERTPKIILELNS